MPQFSMRLMRANNMLELYQQRHLIDFDPPYQRLSVWDKEKRTRFIDSIVNEIDTPKLYLHDVAGHPATRSEYRYSVIDGKQRLLALFDFIENKLKLPDDFKCYNNESYRAGGLTYNGLLTEYPLLRAHFDSYAVPVVLVEADDDEVIEQLFWRLNVQVPLTAPEKRNALGGPLPLRIRRVARNKFFQESIRVKNHRWQHLDLAAKFLYLRRIDAIENTKKTVLDNLVVSFRRGRENGERFASSALLDELEQRTTDILDREHRYFGKGNDLLSSVSRNTLYFHLFRRCAALDIDIPCSLAMLEKFNADVTMARLKSQRRLDGADVELSQWENELVWFDREKQSPNDKGAIERQYTYLANYMSNKFDVRLPEVS